MLKYALSLLALTFASILLAQAPPMQIRNLTATAISQEAGDKFDLRLRFITNVPAVAEAVVPPKTAREPYACNNHRLDLTGLSRTMEMQGVQAPVLEYTVQLALTPLEGAPVTQAIKVAPPKAYPPADAGKVELTVVEPAGKDRVLLPVTAGVPLARAALYRPGNTRLLGPQGPLPLQTRALARWEDGSIKWLLLDTQLDLKANEQVKLTLEYGGNAASKPVTGLEVTDRDVTTGLRVKNGEWSANMPLAGAIAEFSHLGMVESHLVDAEGRSYYLQPETVTVIEPGALRTVVRMDGHYTNGNDKHFMGSLLVTFYAGKPYARVDHVFGNDMVQQDLTPIRSLTLDLNTPPVTTSAVGVVDAEPISGPRTDLIQQFDDSFAGSASGKRLAGWVTAGGVTVAIKDFWQQYPKSFTITQTAIKVGLCPQIVPAGLYANKPDEEKLYYYLRDGNYTFRRGMMKRHELWLGPAAEAAEVTALAAHHATMSCTPEYYQRARAVGDILPQDPAQFAMFDQILDAGADNILKLREQDKEYGLMNWGDWFGERRLNWGNIEYDFQVGMLQQYLRTGDRRFFSLGETAARHNTEIDTIHWAPEPARLPDRGVEPVPGEIWVHSMGHTGGYYPRDYKDMEVYGPGYATNRGHMWVGGNFLYGMLTGDALVLDSANLAAGWMAGPNCTNFDFGNAREPGWMTIAVMAAYRATRDPFYLNAADIMLTKVHEKAQATKPEYGLYYHKLPNGHCDCPDDQKHYGEAGFMAGVLMTGMKRYYQETGKTEVAKDICGIARFIVDTMWVPEENAFRYTSCPKTGPGASSGGIIDEGLAFAANYNDDEDMREIVRLSFANAMLSLQSAGAGKGVGYLLHSMPGAIVEIGKFKGPGFGDFYNRQLQEARSPALSNVPALMPNPNFEDGVTGWNSRAGYKLEPEQTIVHSGTGAVKISGSGTAQNEYMVTRYECGPPWEIMGLQPGGKYRLAAWLRVDEITPGTPAVNLRCSTRENGKTREGFMTTSYDHSKPGTWQRVSVEFTAPAYVTSAYVAININTREKTDILMYADDITLTPAGNPERQTYVYMAAAADKAALTGGAKLAVTRGGPRWQGIVSGPQGGTAAFTVTVPEAGDYVVYLRARNDGAAAKLTVGQTAAEVQPGPWQWVRVTPQALSLPAGEQTLQVTLPANSKIAVQKVVLTNDFAPQ